MPKKTEGPALSYGTAWNIKTAITQLRNRALLHLRHGVTAEDLFNSFVKDKDKGPIKQVMKICPVNVEHQAMTYKTTCDVEANGISVRTKAAFTIGLEPTSEFKFLFPKYMAEGEMLNASPKFAGMIKLLSEIHFEWAQVHQVFDYLNEKCIQPRQLTTLMPWLGTMVAEIDEYRGIGERLKQYKHTIDTPALPLEFRRLALSMERAVAKAQLTPPKSDKPDDEVSVELSEASTSSKRWDGEKWVVKV